MSENIKPGHLGNLSPQQQKKLELLHSKLTKEERENPFVDDYCLLRYLRARDFKTTKAVEMLRDTLRWRKHYNVDSLLENPPERNEFIRSFFRHTFHKFDKRGCPIYIAGLGALLGTDLRDHVSDDDYTLAHAFSMEKQMQLCKASSKKLGRQIETITTVLDMRGLSMAARSSLTLITISAKINEIHYPETMEHMLVIYAPWMFPVLYNVVKPFLDPVVKKKLKVIKGGPKTELRKIIDADCLPKELGGTCKCPDGCFVEPTRKFRMKKPEDEIPTDLRTVKIDAGDIFEQVAMAGPKGAVIGWWFKTDRDIEFSVEWHPCDSDDIEVLRKAERVNAHKYPIQGSFSAEGEGFCRLTWGNTFSRWRAKSLKVSVNSTVLEDDEEDEQKADIVIG